MAALRSDSLRQVETADHAEIMRLLAKRNHDLGRMRARLICRLHNALTDLSPGGIAKELYASDADRLLESYEPVTPIEHMRHQLARELVDDVRRLDTLIKESHRNRHRGAGLEDVTDGALRRGPHRCLHGDWSHR